MFPVMETIISQGWTWKLIGKYVNVVTIFFVIDLEYNANVYNFSPFKIILT